MTYQNEIVLIRGLPGSGKSTLAKSMNEYVHLEADMYLMIDDLYVYDATKVKAAHDWCVAQAKLNLEKGLNVVVSNTFVKLWEIDRYIKLGFPYRIIEMKNRWKNVHGVPEEVIVEMQKRWESVGKNQISKYLFTEADTIIKPNSLKLQSALLR